ncbi:sugar ABC transporter ATP-binding protein [Planctomicrobium sp. SH661]|uniref:sugar ABC transporter ATP-binding protein n=1 Tax=Planctomicrobium sp. SH661 TaxID=3448124 RepID=UPI003F5B560D
MNGISLPLLEVHGVSKTYGDARVLNDCAFEVRSGEIHALVGGNGAGKSTLVRTIAGLVLPTSGKMTFRGEDYAPRNKREAEQSGIEIVQQEFNLIPTLSVAENLLLTRLPSKGGLINYPELHSLARIALDRLGLKTIRTDALVETLGVGQQQMIEIAASLDRQCQLLILDEPTAALSAAESEALFEWLDRLRSQSVGIVYISHRLDEVSRLSDRITVLKDGCTVGTYQTSTLNTDQMVGLMVGDVSREQHVVKAVDRFVPTKRTLNHDATSWAMKVDNLSGGPVKDVSFQVRKGERLGISGLIGSGRTELLRLIFGADIATSGTVQFPDELDAFRFRHPSEAVAAGLAMVTEDRKSNGLLLSQSIRVNRTLAVVKKCFSRLGLIRAREEIDSTERNREELGIRCTSIEQPVGTLSGGNQQKVVISRWLATNAKVFLFDEPTRGIDVPARRRIYQLMKSLADEGKGIVIVSSDLEELFETCDRIAVMSNGRLVETFSRPDFSHGQMMRAAFSGYLERRAVV